MITLFSAFNSLNTDLTLLSLITAFGAKDTTIGAKDTAIGAKAATIGAKDTTIGALAPTLSTFAQLVPANDKKP